MVSKIKILILALIGLSLSDLGYSRGKSDNELKIFSGEYQQPDFFGPQNTTFFLDKGIGAIRPELHQENYLNEKLETDLFGLLDFWSVDLSNQLNCSNRTLDNHSDYIRYLYRLLVISYSFEAIKEYAKTLTAFGVVPKSCPLEYSELLSKCSPQSEDMKKFKQRAKFRWNKNFDKSSFKAISSARQNELLKKLNAKEGDRFLQNQIEDWCRSNNKGCRLYDKKQLVHILNDLCKRDKELIQQVCSETDDVYGLSYAEEGINLLSQSHSLKVINKSGEGVACLERFSKVYQFREKKLPHMKYYLSDIFELLITQRKEYLQGALFLPGALKEFDNKGLTDFLFVPEVPLVIPPLKKYKEKPVVVAAKPKMVEKPLPKPKPIIVKAKPKPKKKTKVKELSAVQKALKKLSGNKLTKVAVDMNDFSDDYIFTPQIITALKEPLDEFQKREGLQHMKVYEKLGSKKEPLNLIFLKYLIDTQSHRGLYNIQAIIGQRFYMLNDIDRDNRPIFIEIALDHSTNNKWQIFVVNKNKLKQEMMKLK
ncbi:MAG: hypothetical protein ACPGJV_13220 [Bacteriovoracaceae bacterium]